MLAASMHAQPGVYAVLLGSGISTGAGVPTGWGVVRDLVGRAAAATAPTDADAARRARNDPEAWWAQHGNGELGYDSLLEALAPTPATRQGLLAGFFEPTDEEREEGVKVPSRAHQALAQLVKRGAVRVVLTTNFDRLTEQALGAAGVAPQVITRPDAVNGMAPLTHAAATVVKLHGDYKDLDSLNTPEELSNYPDAWVTLLRQVFDEYGLIVVGWSADYDAALVRAIESAPNRRYPLYWDSRSSKGAEAQRILRNRGGLVLQTPGADELFTDLFESMDALDRLAQPPLTTAMAIARLKRYLPDPVHRIDLHDLVMTAANDVATHIADQPLYVPDLDLIRLHETYEGHLQAVKPLAHLLVTGIWHDPEGVHDTLWCDVLQRLIDAGTTPASPTIKELDDARLWPALLALTAMGVAAVSRYRDPLIIRLTTEVHGRRAAYHGSLPAAQLLHPRRIFDGGWINYTGRWNGSLRAWPASSLLRIDTRHFFESVIPLEDGYTEAFHGYEYRLGLIHEHTQGPAAYRALSGEYALDTQWSSEGSKMPLAEAAFQKAGDRSQDWPWPAFLGPANIDDVLLKHREVLDRYRYGP